MNCAGLKLRMKANTAEVICLNELARPALKERMNDLWNKFDEWCRISKKEWSKKEMKQRLNE